MSDRLTLANVQARCENVNRRMESRGARVRYVVSHRYDYYAIDRECKRDDTDSWYVENAVRLGTKNELGDFLHAMMVALDDAEMYARPVAVPAVPA